MKENYIGWIQAMDDVLVVNHIGTMKPDDTYLEAKLIIHQLICQEIDMATDHRINGGHTMIPVDPTDQMRSKLSDFHIVQTHFIPHTYFSFDLKCSVPVTLDAFLKELIGANSG